MRTLALGEFTRLRRCSSPLGTFNIIAMDHQDSLKLAIDAANPRSVTKTQVMGFKREIARFLAETCDGILLDAPTGIPAVLASGLPRSTGLLVAIERGDYALEPMPMAMEMEPGWSVTKIAQLGADGVKFFIYDDPKQKGVTNQQDEMIRNIAQECRQHQLPLFAEPIVMIQKGERNFTERVIAAALRQQQLGATILKLEFPLAVEQYPAERDWVIACRELSNALNIPWVLLSAGVDFPTFTKQLKVACHEGASGCIVGRALWGEATALVDRKEREQWLANVALPRVNMLSKITNESARPWWECYPEPDLSAGI